MEKLSKAWMLKRVKATFSTHSNVKNVFIGINKKLRESAVLNIVVVKRGTKGYDLLRYEGVYDASNDTVDVGNGWGAFYIKNYIDAVALAKKAVSMEWV